MGAPRLVYLDGLRGWMALVVVFSHLFRSWLIAPHELEQRGADWLFFWMKWTPLGVITDGLQAVYVFFVISGIALTYPVLRSATPDRTLAAMALYRYPRLTVPILAASFTAWVLLSAGAMRHHAAAFGHPDMDWWHDLYTFPADLTDMLTFALWKVYLPGLTNKESWDFVLWTMPLELIGSFVLFALLALVRWRWLRIALAATVAIYEVGAGIYGYVCGFLAGYLIAEAILASERYPAFGRSLARATPIGWFYLAATLFASIALQAATFGKSRAEYMLAMNIIAVLAVMTVVLNGHLRAWLSGPVSRFLGRISFGLYLTHILVICSFSSSLYLTLIDRLPYGLVVAIIGGFSLVVAVMTGYAFSLLVEERLLAAIKRPFVALPGLLGTPRAAP